MTDKLSFQAYKKCLCVLKHKKKKKTEIVKDMVFKII